MKRFWAFIKMLWRSNMTKNSGSNENNDLVRRAAENLRNRIETDFVTKYMSISKYLSLLDTCSLYFRYLPQLDDQLEGRFLSVYGKKFADGYVNSGKFTEEEKKGLRDALEVDKQFEKVTCPNF